MIVDDIVDTAGTLCRPPKAVRRGRRARRCSRCATHAVLSGPAIDATRGVGDRRARRHRHDSAPTGSRDASAKIHVLSVAPLLGEAIRRTHDEESISSLFV